jgi:hypothetical protein
MSNKIVVSIILIFISFILYSAYSNGDFVISDKILTSENNIINNIQSENTKIQTLSLKDYYQYKLDYRTLKCSSDMTALQCQNYGIEKSNLYYSINNKYLYDSGIVTTVEKECEYGIDEFSFCSGVYIKTNFPSVLINNQYVDIITNVYLMDIPKEERLKLKVGDNIFFLGKIDIASRNKATRLYSSSLTLRDVKIGERKDVDIQEVASSPTSGISSPTGIAYHIDTSPPGNGLVYINNKISPTTGTLPPGSYNIKLVVGSKTYESTMSAVEGGSIELIQPVPTVTPISNIIPIRPPK